ncbi:MAG: ABC transporter permease [Myxococcota bacterium]
MNTFFHDVRYALRSYLRSPLFTGVAVLSLALGISINTAVFSLIDSLLYRPLPVSAPEDLTAIYVRDAPEQPLHGLSYPDYEDLSARKDLFASVIAHVPMSFNMTIDAGQGDRVWGVVASNNYFGALGVGPSVGRVFVADEKEPVVVLSYREWQRRFGGNPGVIGRSVMLNGKPFSVVGVAKEGFTGTESIFEPALWIPVRAYESTLPGTSWVRMRPQRAFRVLARRKAGLSQAQLESATTGLATQLKDQDPSANKALSVTVLREKDTRPDPQMAATLSLFGQALMGLVGLVVLIACANVANLLLVRAVGRQGEMSVRMALGATPGRVFRQLLVESLVLAAFGGLFGLLLSYVFVDLLANLRPPTSIPFRIDPRVDGRALVFTGIATLISGVLFGVLPAFKATATDLMSVLRDEGTRAVSGSRSRLRQAIVVIQVAVSLFLLVIAGLFARSLSAVEKIDPGFVTEGVLMSSVDLSSHGYDREKANRLYEQWTTGVKQLPGVTSVTMAKPLPMDFVAGLLNVDVGEAEPKGILSSAVGPDYFKTLETRIVAGRAFDARDNSDAPTVAIVNETMAKDIWPDKNPIGQTFRAASLGDNPVEVVGVVADGKYRTLTEDPRSYVFTSLAQSVNMPATLVVKTNVPPATLTGAVRAELARLDATVPLFEIKTMDQHLARALFPIRLAVVLVGVLGIAALVLAVVGLYGIVSFTVARRSREIGIRVALGARPSDVVNMVVMQGGGLALVGVGVGLVMALLVSRVMASLLPGVSPTDPLTYVAVTGLLLAIAGIASYLPARRAAKMEAAVALRYE